MTIKKFDENESGFADEVFKFVYKDVIEVTDKISEKRLESLVEEIKKWEWPIVKLIVAMMNKKKKISNRS